MHRCITASASPKELDSLIIPFCLALYWYILEILKLRAYGFSKITFTFLKNIYLFYLTMPGFSCAMQTLQLQHVGSSSLTRDWTQALCIENMES